MTRFDIETYDTVRSRDVDVVRDCIIGLPSPESPGIRVRITKDRLAKTAASAGVGVDAGDGPGAADGGDGGAAIA